MIRIFQNIRDRKRAAAWREKEAERQAEQIRAEIQKKEERLLIMINQAAQTMRLINAAYKLPFCIQGKTPEEIKTNQNIIDTLIEEITPEEIWTESRIDSIDNALNHLLNITLEQTQFILQKPDNTVSIH